MYRRIFGTAAALVATCLLSVSARADCRLPPAPSKVPDAASATEGEMIAAMRTLKRYDTDVTNYCKCLEFEARQSRLSADDLTRMNNSAIDGLKLIADQFNEQVRIFKARGSDTNQLAAAK